MLFKRTFSVKNFSEFCKIDCPQKFAKMVKNSKKSKLLSKLCEPQTIRSKLLFTFFELVHGGSSSSSSYGKVFVFQVRLKKRAGDGGLSFYHPSLLCCPGQMLAVMDLNQHLVSSSKTVKPIIPRGANVWDMLKSSDLQFVH